MWSALFYACQYNHFEVVQEILCHPNCDIDLKDFNGKTAEEYAKCQSIIDLFKEFREIGKGEFRKKCGKVDVEVKKYWTPWEQEYPLHYYSNEGNVEKVKDILKSIQDVNEVEYPSYEQRSALFYACEKNHFSVVLELLCHPSINLNVTDFYGKTADTYCSDDAILSLFTKYKSFGKAKFRALMCVIEKPKCWMFRPWCEKWPLHYYAREGLVYRWEELSRTCDYLNVNVVEEYSYDLRTPLFYACEENHVEMVEWLLSHPEINVDVKDFNGKTSDAYASNPYILELFKSIRTVKREEFLRVLNQTKKDREEKGKQWRPWKQSNPLHFYASEGDTFNFRKYLQEHPWINVNEIESNSYSKWTALFYAIANDHIDIVGDLLTHEKINRDILDFHFKPARSYAITDDMKALLKLTSECEINHFVNEYYKKIPTTERIEFSQSFHGIKLTDEYHHFNVRGGKKVMKYIKRENAFYKNFHDDKLQKLEDDMFKEMVSRINEDDTSVPYMIGDYYYYSKAIKGKEYREYYRIHKRYVLNQVDLMEIQKVNENIELLLDMNELSENKSYISLGTYDISTDGKLIAYSIDYSGDSLYTIYIKNIKENKIIDKIERDLLSSSIEISNDSKSIFYVLKNEKKRSFKVMMHIIGTPIINDICMYEEKDEKFYVGIRKSLDEKYLFVSLTSKVTSEYYYIDLTGEKFELKLIVKRKENVEYYVKKHENNFIIYENSGEFENFRLISTPVNKPTLNTDISSGGTAIELIPYDNKMYITHILCTKNNIIINVRENGFEKLIVYDFTSKKIRYIDFPESVYSAWISLNYVYDTNIIRIKYTSLITPITVFDYNVNTQKLIFRKCQLRLENYNKIKYTTEVMQVTSRDGKTKIPVSLVYAHDSFKKPGPIYMNGYGSYGYSKDPIFNSRVISLLDRGVCYVIPHIRGGSEKGRKWYKDGKLLKKKNTFYDFIDVAKHFIKLQWTKKEMLGIYGASAGGLLMGSVITDSEVSSTKLFKAAVLDVPFVDLMWTMLDTSIPLTVTEFQEWGNPFKKEYFEYMYSYSPYDQLLNVKYLPNCFICGSLEDSAVQYWEPTKFTARARHLISQNKIKNDKLFLKINMGAGHGGSSGRYQRIKEVAEIYAFLFNEICPCTCKCHQNKKINEKKDVEEVEEEDEDIYETYNCDVCKSNAIFQCSRCKDAKYCSLECQRKDWPDHLNSCVKFNK